MVCERDRMVNEPAKIGTVVGIIGEYTLSDAAIARGVGADYGGKPETLPETVVM